MLDLHPDATGHRLVAELATIGRACARASWPLSRSPTSTRSTCGRYVHTNGSATTANGASCSRCPPRWRRTPSGWAHEKGITHGRHEHRDRRRRRGAAGHRTPRGLHRDHAGADDGPATPDGRRGRRATPPPARFARRSARRKGTGPGGSASGDDGDDGDDADDDDATDRDDARSRRRPTPSGATSRHVVGVHPDELPEPIREGRAMSVEAADKSLGPQAPDRRHPPGSADVRSAPTRRAATPSPARRAGARRVAASARPRRSRPARAPAAGAAEKRRRGGAAKQERSTLDPDLIEQRRGRERNGKPIGRYFMCVQVRPGMAQVAVLEGRNLIEHYVSRPADDVSQIHGNIYLGRVQNVLPGMEAAFVDIATPKNAVLYRGDVQYDQEDILDKGKADRPPASRTSCAPGR